MSAVLFHPFVVQMQTAKTLLALIFAPVMLDLMEME